MSSLKEPGVVDYVYITTKMLSKASRSAFDWLVRTIPKI